MSSGEMNVNRSASLRPQSASVGFTKGTIKAALFSFDSSISAHGRPVRSAGSPQRAPGSRRPLSAAIPQHRASSSGGECTATSSIKNDMHLWKFGVPSVPRSPRCFGKPRVSEEKYGHLYTNSESQTTGGGLSSTNRLEGRSGADSVSAAPSSSLGTTSTLPPDDITWRIASSLSPRHPPPKTLVSIERLFGDDHRKTNQTVRWQHSAAHGVEVRARKGFDNDNQIVSINACSTNAERNYEGDLAGSDEAAVFVDIEASHHRRRRLYEEGLKKALGVGAVGTEADEGVEKGVQTAAGNTKDLDFLSLYPHLPITRPDKSKIGHPRRLTLLCESKGPTRKGQRATLLHAGADFALISGNEVDALLPQRDSELCMRAKAEDEDDGEVGVRHDPTKPLRTSIGNEVEVGKPNEIENTNETFEVMTAESSLHEYTALHAISANDPDLGEGLINRPEVASLSLRQRTRDFGGGVIPRRPTSAFGAMYRPWSRLQLEADAASASVGLQSGSSTRKRGGVHVNMTAVSQISSPKTGTSAYRSGTKKRITFPYENPHPNRSKHGCVVLTDEADEFADDDEGMTRGEGKGVGSVHVGSENDERAQWARTLAGSQLAALTAANGVTQMDQYRRNNWKKRKQKSSSSSLDSNGDGGNASSPTSPVTLADLQQQALPFTVSPTQRRGKIVMLDDRVGGLIYEEESANIIPFSLESYGRKGQRTSSTTASSTFSPSLGSLVPFFTSSGNAIPPPSSSSTSACTFKVSDYVHYYTRTDKGSGAVRAVWLSLAATATAVGGEEGVVETAVGSATPRSLELLTSPPSQQGVSTSTTTRGAARTVTGNSEKDQVVAGPNNSSSLATLTMANATTIAAPITGVGVAAQSLAPRDGFGAASLEYFGLYQKYLREIMADEKATNTASGEGGGRSGIATRSVAASTARLQAEEPAHRIFAPRPPPPHFHQSPAVLNQARKPMSTTQSQPQIVVEEIRKEDRLSYALAKALLEDDEEAVVERGQYASIVGGDGAGSARVILGAAVPTTTAITAAYYKRPDGSPRSVFDQLGGPMRRPLTAAEIQKKIADEKNVAAASMATSNKEALDRKRGRETRAKTAHTSHEERKNYGTEWYTNPREWSRKRKGE